MVRALGLPEHLEVVAYLCVGYVDEFPDEPELMQAGWSKRRPLSWVVHEETYGRRALPGEEPHDLLAETVAQHPPAGRQGARRGVGAAEADDEAARRARHAGDHLRAAVRPVPAVPAADPGARGRRDLRRRPRRARPGRHPLAAGGHRPDGRQLPRRRRGLQRLRQPGGRRGLRRRRGRGRRTPRHPRPAAPQGPRGHGRHDDRSRDDPRGGQAGHRGRHRDRPRPGGGRQQGAAHRRDGHREHHRVRRPDLGLHGHRPGRGHRPRHRHQRRDPRPQDRGRPPRPRTPPARPGRPDRRPRRGRRPRTRRAWSACSSAAPPCVRR